MKKEGEMYMKNGVKIAFCVGLFLIGIFAGFIGFKYYDEHKKENKGTEDKNTNDIVKDEKGKELKEPLTLEKITTLANNESLHLQKEYETETYLVLGDIDFTLKIEDGNLKLEGNNKTWKVTDIDEKVIAIEKELLYGCDITMISSLLLTEKGNLYRLYRDERNNTVYEKSAEYLPAVKESFFKQLDRSQEVKLGFVKLNGPDKVQAISTLTRCQEGSTCGGCETIVYMANGEYRYASEGLKEKYIQK